MKKDFVTAVKEFDNKLHILGRRYAGVINNTIVNDAFLMKTDSIGQVNEGATGDCQSEPTTSSMEILPPFSTAFVTAETPLTSTEIQFTSFTPYRRLVKMWAELSCNLPSNCLNVNIVGNTLVCNITDTLVYTAIRNSGCTSPINWLVDTSVVKTISSTDTSIRVYFVGYGNTSIYAKLVSGCSFTMDTINVNVGKSADSLNLGPDVITCPYTSITLFAGLGFESYSWQNGSTAISHTANSPGIYYVDVQDFCGRISRDSVIVEWHAPAIFTVGPDKIKCNADTVRLNATPGFTDYNWTPNYALTNSQSVSTIASPLVDTTYYLQAIDNNGCGVYDTINITVNHSPPLNLGTNKNLCSGDSAKLDAGPLFQDYLWNTGVSSQTLTVFATGSYYVIGTASNGCQTRDTLIIENSFPLPSGFLPDEITFCERDSIQLQPIDNFDKYVWNTGATTRNIIVRAAGNYSLEVIDNNGCKGKEFIVVKEKQCAQGIYFPSAFTPDNNGRNDLFKPLIHERLSYYSFTIYNRWGQIVFSSKNFNEGWDGKFLGVLQDPNVFVWVCRYEVIGMPRREQKGTFVLIR